MPVVALLAFAGCSGAGGSAGSLPPRTTPALRGTPAAGNTAAPQPTAAPTANPTGPGGGGPTATPTPSIVPARSHVMGDNNGGPGALNGFGNDFAILRKYVDVFMRAGTAAGFRSAGGMSLGYADVNLCKGSSRMFANGSTPYASPDCSAFTRASFLQDSAGNPLYVQVGTVTGALGDPRSADLRSQMAAFVAAQIAANGPVDLLWVDDSGPPSTIWEPMVCAAAYPNPPAFPCPNPVNKATIVADTDWRRGEQALVAELPVPTLLNDAAVVAAAPNAAGVMCDECWYYATNGYEVTGTTLDFNLNSAFTAMNAGKWFVLLNENINDVPTRMRAFAIGLLPYRYELEYFFGAGCNNGSGINECPEQAFVADPNPADRNPYPRSLAELGDPSGALVRSFRHCYIGGAAKGPCSAIDNPNLTTPLAVPRALVGAPTLAAHGNPQLCGAPDCAGAAGWIAFDGPPMPSTLPGATAYVVLASEGSTGPRTGHGLR